MVSYGYITGAQSQSDIVMKPTLRAMKSEDLDDICQLQTYTYAAHFYESRDSFAAKLQFFPRGCHIVESGGIIAGYMFSHPWKIDLPTPLDMRELDKNIPADCYYIHDVSVLPSFQGQGLASRFISTAAEIARECRLNTLALVSVQGSENFWNMRGFHARLATGTLANSLIGYGEGAQYMIRHLNNAGKIT